MSQSSPGDHNKNILRALLSILIWKRYMISKESIKCLVRKSPIYELIKHNDRLFFMYQDKKRIIFKFDGFWTCFLHTFDETGEGDDTYIWQHIITQSDLKFYFDQKGNVELIKMELYTDSGGVGPRPYINTFLFFPHYPISYQDSIKDFEFELDN